MESSTAPGGTEKGEELLAWYKEQYEQLEAELTDFRESSRELERELEKDIELAEKRERTLKERAEDLNYEVEEWKRKYRESKSESSTAQNALEKEITGLRDVNRTLQMRIRDIEVANDDFERQARNTTSSLEDMEHKYNVAIERSVLMEEEIKIGEQEREQLRIEAQRLREELSDLKVENGVLQIKISHFESSGHRPHHSHHLSSLSTDIFVVGSPTYDRGELDRASVSTASSSPLVSTPPPSCTSPPPVSSSAPPLPLSATSTAARPTATTPVSLAHPMNVHDPPSPPMSDGSTSANSHSHSHAQTSSGGPPRSLFSPVNKALAPGTRTLQHKSRLPSADYSARSQPKSRPSISALNNKPSRMMSSNGANGPSPSPRMVSSRFSQSDRMPTSNSLNHLRSMTERLTQRVQKARSQLPNHGNASSSTSSSTATSSQTYSSRPSLLNTPSKSPVSQESGQSNKGSTGVGNGYRSVSTRLSLPMHQRAESPLDTTLGGTVTVRTRKRATTSTTNPNADEIHTPARNITTNVPKMPGSASARYPSSRHSLTGTTHVTRTSGSITPSFSRSMRESDTGTMRPPSRTTRESDAGISRPSSRTSGIARPSSRTEIMGPPPRPSSRTNTPVVQHHQIPRPRSSLGSSVNGHGHSHSHGHGHGYSSSISSRHEIEDIDEDNVTTHITDRTPSRQSLHRYGDESIVITPTSATATTPTSSNSLYRRQSVGTTRRSAAAGYNEDLGETF